MTREFATLLAQVLPVLAVALALEIRSLGPRLVALTKARFQRDDAGGYSRFWELIHTGYMASCAVMPALGALEGKALHVASHASKDVPFLAIWVAIAVVFTIPLVQGISFMAEAWDAKGKLPAQNTFWAGPFLGTVIISAILTAGAVLS